MTTQGKSFWHGWISYVSEHSADMFEIYSIANANISRLFVLPLNAHVIYWSSHFQWPNIPPHFALHSPGMECLSVDVQCKTLASLVAHKKVTFLAYLYSHLNLNQLIITSCFCYLLDFRRFDFNHPPHAFAWTWCIFSLLIHFGLQCIEDRLVIQDSIHFCLLHFDRLFYNT